MQVYRRKHDKNLVCYMPSLPPSVSGGKHPLVLYLETGAIESVEFSTHSAAAD